MWIQRLDGPAKRLDLGDVTPATGYWLDATLGAQGQIVFIGTRPHHPAEIYILDSPDSKPRRLTSLNADFDQLNLGKSEVVTWQSPDKAPNNWTENGILTYPPDYTPGKKLPLVLYIHGGPTSASKDTFNVFAQLIAAQGWLVFEPNYRGSTGYGDKFALAIVPEAFSAPGRDILAGVDALVKDGIADPDRLAVGGYSYGGYMTNWLITQTPRFKAAVTGAGAVEYVADWGNDDSSADYNFFLNGSPWERPDRYQSEAAIFEFNKVKTPTLASAGSNDVRVSTLEGYLLERALHALDVPSELLVFPGEGHELDKNPWHGKIMIRENLKWLAKYGGVGDAR